MKHSITARCYLCGNDTKAIPERALMRYTLTGLKVAMICRVCGHVIEKSIADDKLEVLLLSMPGLALVTSAEALVEDDELTVTEWANAQIAAQELEASR